MNSYINNNRSIFIVTLNIFFVFIISANLAWFNPFPETTTDWYLSEDDAGVYKINEKIPLFWQYNPDSGIEILTAAYFPSIFKTYKTRIDRPTYPILINLIGKGVGVIAKPFKKLSPLERTGIGYLILKFIIYGISAFLMFNILKRYISDDRISLFAIFITFIHPHSILYATTFHTTELEFITPIIAIFLFLNLVDNYTLKKNILFSLIFGCIMLAKPNYAVYLTLILFVIYNRYWKESIVSFLVHLLPLFGYIVYLNIIGFQYTNYGAQSHYNQATWIVNQLIPMYPIEFFNEIFKTFNLFTLALFKHYSIWILIFFIGYYSQHVNRLINNKILLFIGIFIFSTFIQCFVGNRYIPYMVSDISIVVYPIVSIVIFELLDNINNFKMRNFVVYIIIFFTTITSLFALTNFPWTHPYDQKTRNMEVTIERLHMVENPAFYTDDDREKAKKGKTLKKYRLY